MSELDEDEASILAEARRALSPTSADERRIFQRLLPELSLPPGVPSGSELPGTSWALRAVAALAVIGAVAFSGGLGYHKGWQAGIAQQNKPPTPANPVQAASAMPAQTRLELAPPVSPARPLQSPSIPSVVRARSETSAASAHSGTSAPSARPEAAQLGLDEEVRQLRRVERAIREDNPRLALVLLDDLDREIPKGQLLEERQAASIMANCRLGADAAVADAHAFAAAHAASAYLARVIEICGLESTATERNSAASGTHVPR
jgi:hypothetical protein